jgi:NodT family efflux transporter outer membrane factor (OMF) lipoprotein
LSDNFSIKQAWNRLEQARALATQIGAAEYPTLDVTAGASAAWNLQSGNRADGYSLGLRTSYELDLWGRIAAQMDAAAFDVAARDADVQSAAITLASQVASVWFQLAASEQRLEVLRRQRRINDATLSILADRFFAGQTRAADYYRQQQLVANNDGDIALATAQVATTRHALAVLVGRTPGDLPAAWQPRLGQVPSSPQIGLPAAVLGRRPDVQSSWLQVAAATQRVTVADADRYPRVTLGADLTTQSSDISELLDGWIFRLAGDLVAPIFDGGRRAAELERTEAVLRERVNAYGLVVLQAIQEVEDALIEERQQQQFVQHLQEQLTANAKVLERTRELYLAGVFDYLRVLEAQTSQQNLQVQDIAAQRDVSLRRLDLYRALAGTWSVPRPTTGVAQLEQAATEQAAAERDNTTERASQQAQVPAASQDVSASSPTRATEVDQ